MALREPRMAPLIQAYRSESVTPTKRRVDHTPLSGLYSDHQLHGIHLGTLSRSKKLPDWAVPVLAIASVGALAVGGLILARPFDSTARAIECMADPAIDKYHFTVVGSEVFAYSDPGQGSKEIAHLTPGEDLQGVLYQPQRRNTYPNWTAVTLDGNSRIGFVPKSDVQSFTAPQTGTNCAGY